MLYRPVPSVSDFAALRNELSHYVLGKSLHRAGGKGQRDGERVIKPGESFYPAWKGKTATKICSIYSPPRLLLMGLVNDL